MMLVILAQSNDQYIFFPILSSHISLKQFEVHTVCCDLNPFNLGPLQLVCSVNVLQITV
jgi:hypothetical protein